MFSFLFRKVGNHMTVAFKELTKAPYRFDIVGSFLRPSELKEARQKFIDNKIDATSLRAVEDQAIIDLLAKQEKHGLKSVTDGEFRRSWWHLDFFWGLNGVKKVASSKGYEFEGEITRAETATLSGLISGTNHPFVADFKFANEHVSQGTNVKQTIPAPAQFLAELQRPENQADVQKFYNSEEALIQAIATSYRQVISDLYDAGCRTIQFDDCTWGMLAGLHNANLNNAIDEETLEKSKAVYVRVNNLALVGKPDDLVVNTHVCRGNYHSHWASAGGYESVATPLFDQENVNAYFLEYDSNRAGGFEPLAKVTQGKYVVLGLVTSKNGELEDQNELIERVHEASRYVPLEYLCLSTQCGFASTEEGNILTEDDQWAKIKLVKTVAQKIWGNY